MNKYQINIKYKKNKLYIETIDYEYNISQIGYIDFKNNIFYPEIGNNFRFNFNKEFKIEHGIMAGVPVYITITKNTLENKSLDIEVNETDKEFMERWGACTKGLFGI